MRNLVRTLIELARHRQCAHQHRIGTDSRLLFTYLLEASASVSSGPFSARPRREMKAHGIMWFAVGSEDASYTTRANVGHFYPALIPQLYRMFHIGRKLFITNSLRPIPPLGLRGHHGVFGGFREPEFHRRLGCDLDLFAGRRVAAHALLAFRLDKLAKARHCELAGLRVCSVAISARASRNGWICLGSASSFSARALRS